MLRLKIAALVTSLSILAGPAFAVCAEGGPNCLKLDQGHIRAGAFVQDDLKNRGEIDCKGGGLCGHDSGGNPSPHAARTTPHR